MPHNRLDRQQPQITVTLTAEYTYGDPHIARKLEEVFSDTFGAVPWSDTEDRGAETRTLSFGPAGKK